MKKKLKSLIRYFIGNLNTEEKMIPVENLSIFFAVLMATLSLRKKQNKEKKINSSFDGLNFEFATEFQLITKRFPALVEIFDKTLPKIRKALFDKAYENLLILFNEVDEDFDEIISWSYQFLKKDLEKKAFNKIGKNNNKLKDSELLFTTQFFTDKYMVKYLVNESLESVVGKDISKIVVIDCASGCGNFLNYSFEKLYEIYKVERPHWSSQQIVDTILNNSILGYDLDANLSKIARLSLFVKACSYSIPSEDTPLKIYGGVSKDKKGFLAKEIKSNNIGQKKFNSEIKDINKEKRIKVFLTNPPFMGKRDMDSSLKNFLLSSYPESKGDLCVSFLQRIIRLMNENDVLGVVTQNSWMYLSSFKEFRRFLLEQKLIKECVDLGSNAFMDINGEKSNIALCIIGDFYKKQSKFYNLKYKNLDEKKDLLAYNKIPHELTFELNQSRFLSNEDFKINYQMQKRFNKLKKFNKYSEFAHPMQGTSTGNNSEFVKYIWEVNGNSDWQLVSKGGGFSKWSGLNYYKVLWGKNAELIKKNKGSALRNINKISSTQLVYSDTGTLGLNVRLLKDKQVFIASGPGIQVFEGDKHAHLAFLNSRVATFLLKLLSPKLSISAGYISNLPVASNILDSNFIAEKGLQCLELKEKYLENKLPNIEFRHHCYKEIDDIDSFLEGLILEDIENDYQRLFLEAEIEIEIKAQYNFNLNELLEIKRIVGEPAFFKKERALTIFIEELDSFIDKNLNINCLASGKIINGYAVGSESLLENLSNKYDVTPKIIYDLIKENVAILKKTKEKYLKDLLHKIVLKELGIIYLQNFRKNIVMHKKELFDNIRSKYPFISDYTDIDQILKTHHQRSFFNRPLFIESKGSIVINS